MLPQIPELRQLRHHLSQASEPQIPVGSSYPLTSSILIPLLAIPPTHLRHSNHQQSAITALLSSPLRHQSPCLSNQVRCSRILNPNTSDPISGFRLIDTHP